MILKGNSRANGQDLARHLMNPENNEHVELAEVRGFVSDDLAGAFAEAEAVASGTKCDKFLYSLSVSPSEPMTRAQYGTAIERIEARLGLTDQPRAVVFHVKDGREHAHVAWSRIDTDQMKAIALSFDRQKLREMAQELAHEFGHTLPEGLAQDRGTDRHKAKFNEVSFAHTQQAKRTPMTPQQRKEAVTAAFQQADSAKAFRSALAEHGLTLAWGDKADTKGNRTPVLVDSAGEVHGLRQQIEGARAKEIRDALQLDRLSDVPTVQQAKEAHATNTQEKAAQKPTDTFDAVKRVDMAEKHLAALRDAQIASMKAVKGGYTAQLKTLRDTERDELADMAQRIKAEFQPEWRNLYAQQKDELALIKAELSTPARRIKALLTGQKGDAFDFENRNTLAGAFKFVVKGDADLSRLEKRHEQARKDLGDMQHTAKRTETQEIKERTAEKRTQARTDHKAEIVELARDQKDQRSQAERNLDLARGVADKAGIKRDTDGGGLASRFARLYGQDELDRSKDEVRKDARAEREAERTQGDDSGRKFER